MPITFVHPAAILPLKNVRWISATGLIIGSIVPDFEYFLRLRQKSYYSHTLEGMFWFDLPLAILFAIIFHRIIKKPLLDRLPAYLQSRFGHYGQLDWWSYATKHTGVIVLSMIIGIGSHLLWDSFTHRNGYFVLLLGLREKLVIGPFWIKYFGAIQAITTLLGAVALGRWIHRQKIRPFQPRAKKPYKLLFWSSLIIFSGIVVVIRLKTGVRSHHYDHMIVSFIGALLLSLIVVCAGLNVYHRWIRTARDP